MTDTEMARALADADRQLAHVHAALAALVADAHGLREALGPTQAWALLSKRVGDELGCTTTRQGFAVEMLVAAALQLNDA